MIEENRDGLTVFLIVLLMMMTFPMLLMCLVFFVPFFVVRLHSVI